MHEAKYLNSLSVIAEQLNQLPVASNPTVGYDLFADALVWSDEYPKEMAGRVRSFDCLKLILRYRTAIICGDEEAELEVYWNAAKQLFPKWPGFLQLRCSRSTELQQEFDRLKKYQSKLLRDDWD